MDNVCEDFSADKHLFDFSRYKKESWCYDEWRVEQWNYRRVCCFEGEDVFGENKESRNEVGKGSEEGSKQKKDISHQDFVNCFFEERKFMHTMQSI